jgi:hypothetical protein
MNKYKVPPCAYCGGRLRYNAGNRLHESVYVHEDSGKEKCEAMVTQDAQMMDCPNCYCSHFRPCHVCGDSGFVLSVAN